MHLAKKTPAGSALGASGLVALGFSYGWHSEVRSFVMASVANGLKMGELITGSKRRLFWAVVAPTPQSPLGPIDRAGIRLVWPHWAASTRPAIDAIARRTGR